MEAAMTTGMLLGLASTSYLYKAVGYTYVFLLCAAFMALSILHTFFFVKECKDFTEKSPSDKVQP